MVHSGPPSSLFPLSASAGVAVPFPSLGWFVGGAVGWMWDVFVAAATLVLAVLGGVSCVAPSIKSSVLGGNFTLNVSGWVGLAVISVEYVFDEDGIEECVGVVPVILVCFGLAPNAPISPSAAFS